MKRLIKESGIRDINKIAKRYKKAKIYFHQDLDGVTTAIAMKNYLEQNGIEVVDAEVIQYGAKEFAVKKPEGEGDVMPVLVDFAHGKPMFVIHTDHHDTQAGVEKETSTSFREARSNVETVSQILSPKEIFSADDILLISTVDSANFIEHKITPDMVMNFLFRYDKDETLKRNKMLMGLVVNKLILAYKNHNRFMESLVLNSKPSLLSILNNIKKMASEQGFLSPEDMKKNQEEYVQSRGVEGKNLEKVGNIISQYGFGSMKKGGYDRYTPFKKFPEADFLVTGMPFGTVQASCNPYKAERALKGVNLGEIKDEVLQNKSKELSSLIITFGDIKRVAEQEAENKSVGFTFKDMLAIYGDRPSFKMRGYDSLKDILNNVSKKLYRYLSPKQKELLEKVTVNGLDVIKANSGGHKCITNISGINFLYRKKNGVEPPKSFANLVREIQDELVRVLNNKIQSQQGLKESVNKSNLNKPFVFKVKGNVYNTPGIKINYLNPNKDVIGFSNLLDFDNSYNFDWDIERFDNNRDKYCVKDCDKGFFNSSNSVYLHDLRVHDEHQGKGYSKKLMNMSHKIAKDKGFKYVTLITACDNIPAQNLYNKLGYVLHQTDGVKDFYYKKI
jgi:ribosomal protein S18 acetylase RimI-like enzyme